MIVLDSCVLIAHLDDRDAHHQRAEGLLMDLADEPWGASVISLAEVLVGPTRSGRLGRATGALNQLGLTAVPLGADAPARLAMLRVASGLKLPDCCVLLAAEQSQSAIATFDDRLAAAARELAVAVRGG